jgi:hypothetical protein
MERCWKGVGRLSFDTDEAGGNIHGGLGCRIVMRVIILRCWMRSSIRVLNGRGIGWRGVWIGRTRRIGGCWVCVIEDTLLRTRT